MTPTHNADNPRAVPGGNQPPTLIDQTWSIYREVSAFLAETPVIADGDKAKDAKLFWDRAKVSLDELEDERDGKVRPLNTQVKTINGEYKTVREPLEKLRGELQSRMSAWALAEERRLAAEAEAAREVARLAEQAALEAEEREREAIENAAQGEFTDVGDAIGEADEAFSDYEKASRDAARAERDVKGRIAGGFGRAFTVRTTETLSVTNAGAALAAIVAKVGSVPAKLEDALLSAARDYRKMFGSLPAGIAVEHGRG